MTNPEPEFALGENEDGSFTIYQRRECDEWLDYELELGSHQEAIQVLSQINWLEDVYSPPRK